MPLAKRRKYTGKNARVLSVMASSKRRLYRLGGRAVNTLRPKASELKNLDITNTSLFGAGSGAGTLSLLNGCVQGTTATTRLGRAITMKSLLIRSSGYAQATTAGSGAIRFMVVLDKQANATAPANTDILNTDDLPSPMNLSNGERFKVLFDKVWNFQTANASSWGWKKYIKLNERTTFNTGNGGGVGDIQTGALYSLSYQDGGIITAAPTMTTITRIRFADS